MVWLGRIPASHRLAQDCTRLRKCCLLSCPDARQLCGAGVQDLAGYWRTQKEVVLDVWAVLQGPERRAVRLALVIAFLDQGMASTAIVNYAPQVPPPIRPQQCLYTSHSRAPLWCL